MIFLTALVAFVLVLLAISFTLDIAMAIKSIFKHDAIRVGGLRVMISELVGYGPTDDDKISVTCTDDVTFEVSVDQDEREKILRDLDKHFKIKG